MDTAFWIQVGITILIGGIGIYYAREQVLLARSMNLGSIKKQKIGWARRNRPIFLIVGLAMSSWIPYFIRPDDLPEFPDPHPYVIGYSQSFGARWCRVVINGQRFLKFQSHYKVAGACYLYDGIGDLMDVAQLQVGKAHDIRDEQIDIMTPFGPGFSGYLESKRAIGLTHVVLLIPKGIDPGDFSTLRQAKAMGVKIVSAGTSYTTP